MNFDTLDYAVADSIATITLNRPDNANSLDVALARDLLQAAIAAVADPAVRAIVITGRGRFFCAGGDLASFAAVGDNMEAVLREVTAYLHSAIGTLAQGDKPVITAINGTAAGAGFSLAITGDFVVSAESARFTMAYTNAGLSPDGSSTWFLPRLVGARKARELMMLNPVLSAAEALELGLLYRVVPDDELEAAVAELATTLASGPTRAYGQVKRLLQASGQNGLESQMQLETEGIVAMGHSADGHEGVSAFLDKRKPVFSGA